MQPHPALSVLIALVITVLTASFLFSVGYAVFEEPQWDDFCDGMRPYPDRFGNATQEEIEDHEREMRTCGEAYNDARESVRNNIFFLVTGLSVLVIIGALAMRPAGVNLTFYVVSGVVFGGLVAILIATMQNWTWFARLLRPIVLLFEIVLVIGVAYWLFSPKTPPKGSRRKE